MGYYKKTVECGNGYQFITKYTGGTRSGKRAPKSKPTSEKKKLYNLRKAIERLYYTLLCNFNPGDYNLVLTYPAGSVMSEEEANDVMIAFLNLYRAYCKENGYRCDYVYNTEIGKKGKLHHHIILHNHHDLEVIEELWAKSGGGAVQYKKNSKLWANYDWYGLAEYYVDKTKGGKLPDTHVPGKRRYTPSKGLKKPKITLERIDSSRWNKPRAPKGWYIVPDSVQSGFDELTGGRFIKYTLRRRI